LSNKRCHYHYLSAAIADYGDEARSDLFGSTDESSWVASCFVYLLLLYLYFVFGFLPPTWGFVLTRMKHKQKQNYKNVQLAQVVSHYSANARSGRFSATNDDDDDASAEAATAAPRQIRKLHCARGENWSRIWKVPTNWEIYLVSACL